MSLLFRDYAGTPKAFDEVVGAEGVRVAYGSVLRQLAKLDSDEVRARADYLKSTYLDQGVTFDIGGEERPFPLDIVPRVLLADEWADVEVRVRVCDAVLQPGRRRGHHGGVARLAAVLGRCLGRS